MTLLRPLLLLAASAPLLGAQPPAAPSWAPALDSITRAALTRTGTPGVQVAIVLDVQPSAKLPANSCAERYSR